LTHRWTRKAALSFILLFGAVNLFADMTYEGARSITGQFLGSLGANGLLVSTIAGFGELLGYTLRLASGRWADRSRLYWPITIVGYVVQMASVPALALIGNWPMAALLILLERVGRATRNPPRDVMLAEAGEQTGRGWAFGVNEALDQLGALIGPLVVAGLLARQESYRLAFAVLAIPAVATLTLVSGARLIYPNAGQASHGTNAGGGDTYPSGFWWYLAATSLIGFGLADFSLIAFHFSKAQSVAIQWIPVFYALAMAAGGFGSLIIGNLFDRIGLIILIPVTVVVSAYAPLAFFGGFTAAMIGVVLWGIGVGAHESVMQAAVAQMISQDRLGSAYGLFGAAFGVAWFVGSVAMGALYDYSIPTAVWLAVTTQLISIVPLIVAVRMQVRSRSEI